MLEGCCEKVEPNLCKKQVRKRSENQRQENSITVLCEKFCAFYQGRKELININEAAKLLGTQRRRLYEILNIVQSVGLISRVPNCLCKWEGDSNMVKTLVKLKEAILPFDHKDIHNSNMTASKEPKKSVATCLSERFIQIFLCEKFPSQIVLEEIMDIFTKFFGMGHSALSHGRRVYDIANVFCSLNLIKRSTVECLNSKKKKILYSWNGPSLLSPVHNMPKNVLSLNSNSKANNSINNNTTILLKHKRTELKSNSTLAKRLCIKTTLCTKPQLGGAYVTPPSECSRTPEETLTPSICSLSSSCSNNMKGKKCCAQHSTPPVHLTSQLSPFCNCCNNYFSTSNCNYLNSPMTPTTPLTTNAVASLHSVAATTATTGTGTSTGNILYPGTIAGNVSYLNMFAHNPSATTQSNAISPLDFNYTNSPLLLKVQVETLKKELENAKINKLIDHNIYQDTKRNKFNTIDTTKLGSTFVFNSNSPITNFMISPFGKPDTTTEENCFHHTNHKTKKYKKYLRVGPALPDFEPFDLNASSPSPIPSTNTNNTLLQKPSFTTTAKQATPSSSNSSLVACAATSLLSLTPQQIDFKDKTPKKGFATPGPKCTSDSTDSLSSDKYMDGAFAFRTGLNQSTFISFDSPINTTNLFEGFSPLLHSNRLLAEDDGTDVIIDEE